MEQREYGVTDAEREGGSLDPAPLTTQQQDFGDDPLDVRATDHYTSEYVSGFVSKWDELIDWRKR